VLSGFLISGLLFSEFKRSGTIDVKRFWMWRGFKIYPGLYVLVCFLAAVSLARTGRVPGALLGDVFFVQNYFAHVTSRLVTGRRRTLLSTASALFRRAAVDRAQIA
jgi:peptidoglycan/LPS O-acetylase OafA/YrhL